MKKEHWNERHPRPQGTPELPPTDPQFRRDSTTYIAFEPPLTPEQACRDIEEVAGTSVEVFTNSMGRGDETFSHPTGFGEIYGSNVTEWPQAEGWNTCAGWPPAPGRSSIRGSTSSSCWRRGRTSGECSSGPPCG